MRKHREQLVAEYLSGASTLALASDGPASNDRGAPSTYDDLVLKSGSVASEPRNSMKPSGFTAKDGRACVWPSITTVTMNPSVRH